MKIVFINTPTQKYPDSGRPGTYTTMPPFGLGYVATAAAQVIGRENVEIIDGEQLGLSPKNIADAVMALKPDYVGVNMFSPTFDIAQEIIEHLGPELGRNILVGGTHAILDPASILENDRVAPFVKFVVTGEGELPIVQLLSQTPLENIEGVAYEQDGKITLKEGWQMSQSELNDLILDHSFFRNDPNFWKDGHTRESYLLSSRGCPFDCHFCAAKEISGRHVRMRNTASIKKELQQLHEHGINYVRFMDDLLLISPKRIEELHSVFADLGLNQSNFGFEANGRANIMSRLSDQHWSLLAEMGMHELEIGIESGSEKILKRMNKIVSSEQVVTTVERAQEHGIGVKGFLMVGYPGEDQEDLEATIELTRTLKGIAGETIRFSPVPVKAYPGTHLHEETEVYMANKGYRLTEERPVDVATMFRDRLSEEDQRVLSERTRYNAMHTAPDGSLVTLSELSGHATSEQVLWALCQLILISEGRNISPEGSYGRGKEQR